MQNVILRLRKIHAQEILYFPHEIRDSFLFLFRCGS